ncbi:MAG: dynamin family protein [Lentisphaeria bacterium]|nr:dynamin family protein [Lentisphaeria bacterium]
MNIDFSTTQKKLSSIKTKLEQLKKDYPALVDETLTEIRNFESAAELKMNEGRQLSISIVGRVKSGKSSLLNALLFDGEQVLPQAATPMTAALTFIRYAPECRAEIEFFTQDEWSTFEVQAAQYDKIIADAKAELIAEDAEEARRSQRFGRPAIVREITHERIINRAQAHLNENFTAAHELVTMAENSGINVEKLLSQGSAVIKASSPEDLAGKLESYVGAGGKYTPVVCSTTLYINDPRLEGYEIIDTPGTNDPIISRGQKTKQSLAKTDVVLALSHTSRFFDKADLELLSQNLPKSGVNHFQLIASQFDVAVKEFENQIPREYDPLKRLLIGFKSVQSELQRTFHERVEKIAQQAADLNNGDTKKWDLLLQTQPICVSAMAFTLAKHWNKLTAKEKEELALFNDIIPGYTFDREMLNDFSRMDKVHEIIDSVKEQKTQILADGFRSLVEAGKKAFAERAHSIAESISSNIETLENKDVASLARELKIQTQRLEKGRSSLEGCFEDVIYDAHGKFADILSQIRLAKAQFTNLSVQTESRTEYEDYTVDKGCGFLFWRSLTGNRYETRTRSYTVTTRYADAYEAVDQVESYANESRALLENAIRDAVNVTALRNNISDAILNIFENGTEDIDIDMIKEQIKSAIRRITIPDADFGNMDYTETITSKFSGSRVEGADIETLKSAQRSALNAVISDLEAKAKEKAAAIETCLKNTMESFVNQLIGDLKAENEKLAEKLNDKEANLKHLKKLLPVVAEIESEMKNL